MAEYTLQGRQVTLPLTVGAATCGMVVTTASLDAVTEALPDGLLPVSLPRGRAAAIVAMVRYLDNPLGDYDEGIVGFAVTPVDDPREATGVRSVLAGRVGLWVEHMPVTQSFTREAGEAIWGFPKTVDDLDFQVVRGRGRFSWKQDGQDVLDLDVPARGALRMPQNPACTFTVKDGLVVQTHLSVRASGWGLWPGRGLLTLGSHPIGRRLADLGLDGRVLGSAWMHRATMTFGDARPIAAHG